MIDLATDLFEICMSISCMIMMIVLRQEANRYMFSMNQRSSVLDIPVMQLKRVVSYINFDPHEGTGCIIDRRVVINAWGRHQMETFSALLALCVGNSPVTSESHTQRLVTRNWCFLWPAPEPTVEQTVETPGRVAIALIYDVIIMLLMDYLPLFLLFQVNRYL